MSNQLNPRYIQINEKRYRIRLRWGGWQVHMKGPAQGRWWHWVASFSSYYDAVMWVGK